MRSKEAKAKLLAKHISRNQAQRPVIFRENPKAYENASFAVHGGDPYQCDRVGAQDFEQRERTRTIALRRRRRERRVSLEHGSEVDDAP